MLARGYLFETAYLNWNQTLEPVVVGETSIALIDFGVDFGSMPVISTVSPLLQIPTRDCNRRPPNDYRWMICPGPSGQGSWIGLVTLALLACLIFVFYQAQTRPAQPTPPQSQPLHDSK
jgi:hypothetical protein